MRSWKSLLLSLGLTSAFILGAGMSTSSNAYAQFRRNQCPSGQEMARREQILRSRGWDGRLDWNGNVDLNRNGVDDRCEDALFQGSGYGYDRYGNRGYSDYDRYGNRTYRNNPYDNYGYDNYGYNNYGYRNEEQRGYRDGLVRGREDALSYRAMNPNNSEHYRDGDPAYRAGFERGFYEAYRQYGRRRW